MKLSKYYRTILRYRMNKKNRHRLTNKDFTVICSNCVGGVMYHELGQKFNSPTVALFFSSKDFIKFVANLEYYLSCELKELKSDKTYPVGKLDDITIYFMHYPSFDSARSKWIERCKRINMKNVYVIMVERAGCSEEMIKEFNMLPYKNKVIFTAKEHPDLESAVYISGSEQLDGQVMDLCLYKTKFTGKRWLDEFDYVEFFNRT